MDFGESLTDRKPNERKTFDKVVTRACQGVLFASVELVKQLMLRDTP